MMNCRRRRRGREKEADVLSCCCERFEGAGVSWSAALIALQKEPYLLPPRKRPRSVVCARRDFLPRVASPSQRYRRALELLSFSR